MKRMGWAVLGLCVALMAAEIIFSVTPQEWPLDEVDLSDGRPWGL